MDEFVKQLSAKVGIDEATATKVVEYVTENWDDIVKWMSKDKFEDAKDSVGDVVEDAKDSVGDVVDEVKEKLGGFLHKD